MEAGAMSNVIEFDAQRGREGLAKRKTNNHLPTQIEALRREVESAQQAYASRLMIENGYCGAALKQEIANAQSLQQRLSNCGNIIASIILTFGSQSEKK
jgi:hypothetical protein